MIESNPKIMLGDTTKASSQLRRGPYKDQGIGGLQLVFSSMVFRNSGISLGTRRYPFDVKSRCIRSFEVLKVFLVSSSQSPVMLLPSIFLEERI